MHSDNIKFILHGGFNPEKTGEDSHAFYEEILKDTSDNVAILLVPFAKDADRVAYGTDKVSKEFQKVAGAKNLSIMVATQEGFIDEVKRSDVIYFHGGVSVRLLDILKQYVDLESVLKGKVVAGDSAGANVWCKFFYSPHADGVFEGLGLLPVKIIPHYKEEYAGKLDGTDPSLETVLLPEYEFKVFEIPNL